MVQRLNVVRIQRQTRGADQLIQLRQRGGADDRRGDARTRDQPGQRDLRRRDAVFARHLIQRRQDAETARVQVAFDDAIATLTFALIRFAAVFAGQKAAGQREEVDHPEAMALRHPLQLGFIPCARIQIVFRLQGFVARQSVALAHPQRFFQAIRLIVGGADRPHLAGLNQRIERRQRLFQRRIAVIVVRLVEIDIIGLQTAQRIFHRLLNIARRQPLFAFAHRFAHLGGDDHLVALAALLQPFADDGFRFAAPVARRPAGRNVGGIDKVELIVHQRIQQIERGRLIRRPAEHVAAKGQRRHLNARTAQLFLAHHKGSMG